MSSILDALQKVEEEKTANQQVASHTIAQDDAEHDLMGPNTLGRVLTIRMSPTVLIAAAVVFSVILAGVSVGAAVYVAQSQMGDGGWRTAGEPSATGDAHDGDGGMAAVAEDGPSGEERASASKPDPYEPQDGSLPGDTELARAGVLEETTKEAVIQDEAPEAEEPGAPSEAQELETDAVAGKEELAVETDVAIDVDDPATGPDAMTEEEEPETDDPTAEVEEEHEPSQAEPGPEDTQEGRTELDRIEEARHRSEEEEELSKQRTEDDFERLSSEVRRAEQAAERLREQRAQSSSRSEEQTESPEVSETRSQAYSPPATDNKPVDMESLPSLTQTARRAHGLENMQINMLRAPSENRPRPSALIDFQVVYVGETIPDTDARLLAVSVRGIAIEVNGARYYVRR